MTAPHEETIENAPGLRETGDGSLTLYSERYGQTFHSQHGAVRESRHVFLEASGVVGRLAAGQPARILEIGFGTGLNFFLTAQAAVESGAPLHYLALERELLPAGQVRQLGYGEVAPDVLPGYLAFREGLGTAAPGSIRFSLGPVELTLALGEATEAPLGAEHFDTIYHDAFSPDANPELWTREFIGSLLPVLRPNGTLVTYSVKGEVRRLLAGLGLQVEKLPGPPGGKREMLRAVKETPGNGTGPA